MVVCANMRGWGACLCAVVRACVYEQASVDVRA